MSKSLRAFGAFGVSICLAVTTLAGLQGSAIAGQSGGAVFASDSAASSSWVAGIHGGYNWQQGAAVFGFETDLQATHLRSSTTSNTIGDFAATAASIDWYGTLRGRVGVASGPWLFYATAGLAYGDVS